MCLWASQCIAAEKLPLIEPAKPSTAIIRTLAEEPFRAGAEIEAIFSTRDEKTIFAQHVNEETFSVIDAGIGKTLGTLPVHRRTFDVTPNGTRVCGVQRIDGKNPYGALSTFSVWSWPEREVIWSKETMYPELVKFSPDGKLLATIAHAAPNALAPGLMLTVASASTGEELWSQRIEQESFATSAGGLAFAGDDRLLLALRKVEPHLRCYEARTGKPLAIDPELKGEELKFSSTPGTPAVLLFQPYLYYVLRPVKGGKWERFAGVHAKDVYASMYFYGGGSLSPDGRHVLMATREACRVYPADQEEPEPIAELPVRGEHAHYFGSGRRAVISFDERLVIVPTDTWQPNLPQGMRAHVGRTEQVQFSPDGKLLASHDGEHLLLWDLASGGVAARIPSPTEGRDIMLTGFHPKQPMIYGHTGPEVWWWDYAGVEPAQSGWASDADEPPHRRLMHMKVPPRNIGFVSLAFDAGGKRLLKTTRQYASLLEFAPDLHDIATSLRDLKLEGWPKLETIRGAAMSGDGKRAVFASLDIVRVYELDGGRLLREEKVGETLLSPDARFYAVRPRGLQGPIRVHSTATGELAATLTPPEDPARFSMPRLAWSPDSTHFAAAGHGLDSERTGYIVWQVEGGKCLGFRETHRGRSAALAFSWDNKQLAAANGDGSIDIWDLAKALEATLK